MCRLVEFREYCVMNMVEFEIKPFFLFCVVLCMYVCMYAVIGDENS